MLSRDMRVRLVFLNDLISKRCLQISIPVMLLAVGYLLFALFGGKMQHLMQMQKVDRAYFVHSIDIAILALKWSSIVMVVSLVLRFFFDEALGQVMTVVGGLITCAVPSQHVHNLVYGVEGTKWLVARIISSLCILGFTILIPGVWLVLRDCVVRIWRAFSEKRELKDFLGDSFPTRPKRTIRPMGQCWHMSGCRQFVREVCPAFQKKRSCWRLKTGCHCDENLILQAMAGKEANNEYHRKFLESLGAYGLRGAKLSGSAKRARCRKCAIYAEHQIQKARVLSPLVFPGVGAAFYIYYAEIAGYISKWISQTDKFFAFVAYSTTQVHVIQSNTNIMTLATVVWLAIIAICYCLRALEYLIFDLQV